MASGVRAATDAAAGLRVGIDVSPLQTGHRRRGIGSYALGLLYGLARLDTGARFTLYYWRGLPLDLAGVTLPADARWVGLPYLRVGRASALFAQQLLQVPALLASRPDVYHQLGIVPDPAAGGLPWAMLDRAVVTVHDLTPLVYRDRFLAGKHLRHLTYGAMLRGVRRARQVLADSESTRRDLVRLLGLRPEQVTVAPLAVPPGLAAALLGPSGSPGTPEAARTGGLALRPDAYFLTVAGDYPNKGLATLLAAYGQVARDPGAPDLVLVGPPGPAVARFRECEPGAAARLRVLSQASEAELARLYRGALAVAVPSEYEGFGLPALEAMAAGVPVVASDAASLPEVVGDAALLVPPRDPAALAEALRRLRGSRDLREGLRARGLERVRSFTWERTAAITFAAYCRAAGRQAVGRSPRGAD